MGNYFRKITESNRNDSTKASISNKGVNFSVAFIVLWLNTDLNLAFFKQKYLFLFRVPKDRTDQEVPPELWEKR